MRYLVAVARPSGNGWQRGELGNWLIEVVQVAELDPEVKPCIEDVLHINHQAFPTNIARNQIVDGCQKAKVDILYMVDSDSVPPPGWFKAAFKFLTSHAGPAVIGCPYVCGGHAQNVQVFEWESPANHPQPGFALRHIGREDAARRTGIQEVANIGTHCIAYNMRAFEQIERPYYAYSYNDAHTQVLDTEEVSCHRRMHLAGVPIYVSWDHWSAHWKEQRVDKPWILDRSQIIDTYMKQAESLIRSEKGTNGDINRSVQSISELDWRL